MDNTWKALDRLVQGMGSSEVARVRAQAMRDRQVTEAMEVDRVAGELGIKGVNGDIKALLHQAMKMAMGLTPQEIIRMRNGVGGSGGGRVRGEMYKMLGEALEHRTKELGLQEEAKMDEEERKKLRRKAEEEAVRRRARGEGQTPGRSPHAPGTKEMPAEESRRKGMPVSLATAAVAATARRREAAALRVALAEERLAKLRELGAGAREVGVAAEALRRAERLLVEAEKREEVAKKARKVVEAEVREAARKRTEKVLAEEVRKRGHLTREDVDRIDGYRIIAGRFKGKTLLEVWEMGTRGRVWIANMSEGAVGYARSLADQKMAREFVDAHRAVEDWVDKYFADTDRKSPMDLTRGRRRGGFDERSHLSSENMVRRKGALEEGPRNTDTTTMSGEQPRRDRRRMETDYEGRDSEERAEVRRRLFGESWQRARRVYKEMPEGREWQEERDPEVGVRWKRWNAVRGRWEYRKKDPNDWMRKALGEGFERVARARLAKQILQARGVEKPTAEQIAAVDVVEVMVKARRLRDRGRAFQDRNGEEVVQFVDEEGNMVSAVETMAVEQGEVIRARNRSRGRSMTDRAMEGAPEEDRLSYYERVMEAVRSDDLGAMESLERELHGEFDEFNLESMEGELPAYRVLKKELRRRREDLKAASSPTPASAGGTPGG